MKRTRKGFTLVELLIVVAILATLTATMMVSMRGATAKAKAASIAANLESCHTAAMLYYAASGDKDLSDVGAEDMLKVSLKTWAKMKGTATTDSAKGDAITYSAAGKGVDNWVVNVDFSNDTEATDIARALKNMRGYSDAVAFVGSDELDFGFDFFGATPAYAEVGNGGTESGTTTGDTSNKLYMILITGEIKAGKMDQDTLPADTTTETQTNPGS